MHTQEERDMAVYRRRIDAAKWLASGLPRLEIVEKLRQKHGVQRRQAHKDINQARSGILPALCELGEIEERVAEGLVRVESHYQQAMSAGQWSAATATLKMLISILGCQADQVLSRERIELERVACKLREMELKRKQAEGAAKDLADTDDSTLAQMIEDLRASRAGGSQT